MKTIAELNETIIKNDISSESVGAQANSISNDSQTWLNRAQTVIMNTYSRFPLVIAKGNGCRVEDTAGKSYLDFVAGVAVNSLGHCNDAIVKAINAQLTELIHSSNLYFNKPSIEVAEALTRLSGFNKVFFCNSGTEANEAAIKLARKFSKQLKGEHCTEVISLENSFHGRTFGALSATGQVKHQKDFSPLLTGFKIIPVDLEKLKETVSDKTSAIIVEPIQGEGGVISIPLPFLKALREICDENHITLIFDEIQCGIGRTGHLFAYEGIGIKPDAMTIAKGFGGGFPIGALLANDKLAQTFQPGDHGSTFGGNPIACSAALVVLNEVTKSGFLSHVETVGSHLQRALLQLKIKYQTIIAVRGIGLMQAVELDRPASPIIEACIEKGLLLALAGPKVLRFLPPLTISSSEIDEGVSILDQVLGTISQSGESK